MSSLSYIQIELEETAQWHIEACRAHQSDGNNSHQIIKKSSSKVLKKISESVIKEKLQKSLSLQKADQHPGRTNAPIGKGLRFELNAKMHKFQMRLDLAHVNIFEAILEHREKIRSSKSLFALDDEDLEPLRVTANVMIFYCVDPNMSTRN